jgi:hypothetical protein
LKGKNDARAMAVAEEIIAEDRDILGALAASERADQMAVAREVMARWKGALKKLGD